MRHGTGTRHAASLFASLALSSFPAFGQQDPAPETPAASKALAARLLDPKTREAALAAAATQLESEDATLWLPVLEALQQAPAPELDLALSIVGTRVIAAGSTMVDRWLQASATSAGPHTEPIVRGLIGSIIMGRHFQDAPPCSMAVLCTTFERLFPADCLPVGIITFATRPFGFQPNPPPLQGWLKEDIATADFFATRLAMSDQLFPAQRAALIWSLSHYFRSVYEAPGGVKEYLAAPACRSVFVAAIDAVNKLHSAHPLSFLLPLYMRPEPEIAAVLDKVDLRPLARTPWLATAGLLPMFDARQVSPFAPQNDDERNRLKLAFERAGSPLPLVAGTERPWAAFGDVAALLDELFPPPQQLPMNEAVEVATEAAKRFTAALELVCRRVESDFGLSIAAENRAIVPQMLLLPGRRSTEAPTDFAHALENMRYRVAPSGMTFANWLASAVARGFQQRGLGFQESTAPMTLVVNHEIARLSVELYMARQISFLTGESFPATLHDLSERSARVVALASERQLILTTEYVPNCTLPAKAIPDVALLGRTERAVLKQRQISLPRSEYREVLDFHLTDGSVTQIVVAGRLPTGYHLLLEHCPRALDGIGVSLAWRSMLLQQGRSDLATNALDCILNAPGDCLDVLLSPGEAEDFRSVIDSVWLRARPQLVMPNVEFVLSNLRQGDMKPLTVPGVAVPESIQRTRLAPTNEEFDALASQFQALASATANCLAERAAVARQREEVSKLPDTVRRWVSIPAGPDGLGGGMANVAYPNEEKSRMLRELTARDSAIDARQRDAAPWNLADIDPKAVTEIRPAVFFLRPDATQFAALYRVLLRDGGERWLPLTAGSNTLGPTLLHLLRTHFFAVKSLPIERYVLGAQPDPGRDPISRTALIEDRSAGIAALITRECIQFYMNPQSEEGITQLVELGPPAAWYVDRVRALYGAIRANVSDQEPPIPISADHMAGIVAAYRSGQTQASSIGREAAEKAIREAREKASKEWTISVGFAAPSPFPFSVSVSVGDIQIGLSLGDAGLGALSLGNHLGRIDLTGVGRVELRPLSLPLPPISIDPTGKGGPPLEWDIFRRGR